MQQLQTKQLQGVARVSHQFQSARQKLAAAAGALPAVAPEDSPQYALLLQQRLALLSRNVRTFVAAATCPKMRFEELEVGDEEDRLPRFGCCHFDDNGSRLVCLS